MKLSRAAIAFFVVMGIALLAIDIMVAPARFYDYDTYLLYLDSIYHFRQADWFLFEAATKAYLLALKGVFVTTVAAIEAAHYLLLVIFLLGFYLIFRHSAWEGAAVAAALFAPQLGLVTIRATPAYVICTLAALRAVQGRPWALRLALIGTLFHVSAFLALIPVLATRIISKTRFARFNLNITTVFGVAALAGAIGYLFAQQAFDFLVDLFNQIPYLSKYTAYAVGLADPNAVVETAVREPTSANHYVFLVGISLLFIALVFFEKQRSLLKIFAAISYVLYLGLFFAFSPVPAFRFAPFFALPVLASVRFERQSLLRGLAALPFLAACLAVFALQVTLVID